MSQITASKMSYVPLAAPPRRVVGSIWRGLTREDWVWSWLFFGPVVATVYMIKMMAMGEQLGGDKTGWGYWGAWAFALFGDLFAMLYWKKTVGRVKKIRELCRSGIAARGVVVSKRREQGARKVVTYLFTDPRTGEPVKLEGQTTPELWAKLEPGGHLNVLVEEPPGKAVVVYEFCPFEVV